MYETSGEVWLNYYRSFISHFFATKIKKTQRLFICLNYSQKTDDGLLPHPKNDDSKNKMNKIHYFSLINSLL